MTLTIMGTEAGLMWGKELYVDAIKVKANASFNNQQNLNPHAPILIIS